MQMLQSSSRKYIVIAISLISTLIILARFYGDVPVEYYRNYAPAEAIVPTKAKNNSPQPGYFKDQPEWNWKVPDYSSSWRGLARKPEAQNIVVLTASDGGGHNKAVPNILERTLEDREKYAERHGYTNLWLNTSRYDIGDAHRTWSKIPAVAEAFFLYPEAEWVWLIDTDVIIMSPEIDLVSSIIGPSAISRGIIRDAPILVGPIKNNPPNISMPINPRVEDIDILITQDHQSINTGSMFFRRSAFTRYLLESMTDRTMLMGREHPGAEQDALRHLMLEHQLVRNHVGIYPQRKFNAYAQGGPNMGYRDFDIVVHMAGCWVNKKCEELFEMYWEKRGHVDVWKPEE